MLERPLVVRDDAGSISGRFIPNTLKLVSITTDVLVSGTVSVVLVNFPGNALMLLNEC